MRRWLTLGAVVLLAVWAPFFYAELTSERVEKKEAPVATDPFEHDPIEEAEIAAEGEAPGADEKGEAEAEEEGAEPALEVIEHEELTEEQAKEVAELPAAPEPAAAEGEDEEGEPAEAEEAPAKPPQGSSQASAVLKRAFENEPRDSLWAREAEASLLQIFSQAEFPRSGIHAARCQKTVCKVELTWTSEHADAYMMAFQRVQAKFGSQLGVEQSGQGKYEDEMHMDLYVPREGYSLADLAR